MLNDAWGNSVDACVVSGNNNDGIQLTGGGAHNNIILNCLVGLNPAQTLSVGNGASGIALLNGAGSNAIGSPAQHNVISGNPIGVTIASDSNVVVDNLIGINDNAEVIQTKVDTGIMIYGNNNAVGLSNIPNVICGNRVGVELRGSNNTVQACYIGTNFNQTAGLGNTERNLIIAGGARDNLIGGGSAALGNLIMGAGLDGVWITDAGTSGNKLQRNTIGGAGALMNEGNGVYITDADRNGIGVEGAGNIVRRNNIGTDAAGTGKLSNQGPGVLIQSGAAQNTIDRNVISGNAQSGVVLNHAGTNQNMISGNMIGLNAAGSAALGNTQHGVLVNAGPQNNVIGGNSPYNAISGNGGDGIRLTGGGTSNNTVSFNVIGLNGSGAAVLPNQGNGVTVEAGATANTIGGAISILPSNIIAGNGGAGVQITGAGTSGNNVLGNLIGLSLNNAAGFGNALAGVLVNDGAAFTIIGDDSPYYNYISGNAGAGVEIDGASNNRMQANYVGVNLDGSAALPNAYGVLLYNAPLNQIGGLGPNESNVIAGNTGDGLDLTGSLTTTNTLQNNRIGTNPAGTALIPNTGYGIALSYCDGNQVEANVICGNGASGVVLNLAVSNTLLGNRIGLLSNGAAGPNGVHGVELISSTRSKIGGIGVNQGNTIAFNPGAGVRVVRSSLRGTGPSQGNTIRGNSIYNNGGLGIDLNGDGVTLNDMLDADTGNNLLQNYPQLVAVKTGAGSYVTGQLMSVPSQNFTLDVYSSPSSDPSGFGEGQTWLKTVQVATNAAGNVSFLLNLPTLGAADRLTITATDSAGNTSEFSGAIRTAVTEWSRYP